MDVELLPPEQEITRDPFQLELLDAVKKRRSKLSSDDFNSDVEDHFDAELSRKMSKLSSPSNGKVSTPSQNKHQQQHKLGSPYSESDSGSDTGEFDDQNNNNTKLYGFKEGQAASKYIELGALSEAPRPRPRKSSNSFRKTDSEDKKNHEAERVSLKPVPSPRSGLLRESPTLEPKSFGISRDQKSEGLDIEKKTYRQFVGKSEDLNSDAIRFQEQRNQMLLKDLRDARETRHFRRSQTGLANGNEEAPLAPSANQSVFATDEFAGSKGSGNRAEVPKHTRLYSVSSKNPEGSDSLSTPRPASLQGIQPISDDRKSPLYRGKSEEHIATKDGDAATSRSGKHISGDLLSRSKSPLDASQASSGNVLRSESMRTERALSNSIDSKAEQFHADGHHGVWKEEPARKSEVKHRHVHHKNPNVEASNATHAEIIRSGRSFGSSTQQESLSEGPSPENRGAGELPINRQGVDAPSRGRGERVPRNEIKDEKDRSSFSKASAKAHGLEQELPSLENSSSNEGQERTKNLQTSLQAAGRLKEIDELFNAGPQRVVISKSYGIGQEEFLEVAHEKRSKSKQHFVPRKETKKDRVAGAVSENSPSKKIGPLKADVPLSKTTKSPAIKSSYMEENQLSPDSGKTSSVAPLSTKLSNSEPLKEPRDVSRPLSASKRSHSFTNISNIHPVPPRPYSPDSETGEVDELDSTKLREQIYYDWLQRKNSFVNEKKSEAKNEKERSAQKVQEKMEREVLAKKTYDSWMEKKAEVLKQHTEEKKINRTKIKEKEDEKLQRELDAKKSFENWREKKSDLLKVQKEKKKAELRSASEKEHADKADRIEASRKVYEKWKEQKDELIKDKMEQKKRQLVEENDSKSYEVETKQLAQRAFEDWKDRKTKSPRPRTPSLTQRPWCPSGRHGSNDKIPEVVQPVIIRNPAGRIQRTLSASGRLTSKV